MDGWIKLHRKIAEWEWYNDANTLRLFLHLLINANHEPKRWHGMVIDKGQIVVGRKDLAKKLKVGEQSVRTSLNRLKSTNEITIKSTNKYSIVTILNWDNYQDTKEASNQQNNHQANQQLTSNQPTTNQQLTTNKNYRTKELKN